PRLGAAAKHADEGIGFVFVGHGADGKRLEAAAAGMDNVRFLDFFPPSKIPSVLAAPDAHLITIKRGLEGVVVPSKMYGILAAGKPIVAVAPPETGVVTLGTGLGVGIAAEPDHFAELIEKIRVLAGDPRRVRAMALAAKTAAQNFDRAKELEKFVRAAERIATEEKH